MKSNFSIRGLTLIELMVAIGILTILFTLVTINLTRLPSTTSQAVSYDNLISDLRSQQTLAMTGYNNSAYGISFGTTSYTLFPNTFTVSLDPNLTLTEIKFPGSQVSFMAGTGEITGYTPGGDSVSIANSLTGEVKTIRLNKYGATYQP